jgi:hypothetical protein
VNVVEKICTHGKMRHVKSIPGMEEKRSKGEWWRW